LDIDTIRRIGAVIGIFPTICFIVDAAHLWAIGSTIFPNCSDMGNYAGISQIDPSE
jgi:hypothetical protein